MNKRIKELAHEAGLSTYNPENIPTKLEKFAELIVKECASVVAEHFDSSEPWITPKTILYYFGVEESSIDERLRNRSTYFGNNP